MTTDYDFRIYRRRMSANGWLRHHRKSLSMTSLPVAAVAAAFADREAVVAVLDRPLAGAPRNWWWCDDLTTVKNRQLLFTQEFIPALFYSSFSITFQIPPSFVFRSFFFSLLPLPFAPALVFCSFPTFLT